MHTISMVELRTRAEEVIRSVREGRSVVLTYRGKPVLELHAYREREVDPGDGVYRLAELAVHDETPLTNREMDDIIYGR